MAALSNRKEARERLRRVFEAQLDKLVPADESVPMAGQAFREWEDQADEFDRTVTATLLEELAALSASAQVKEGGRCPYCASEKVYLDARQERSTEVRTNHGVVVVGRQSGRCRSCGRSFSPSGPGLGPAPGGGGFVAQGGPKGGAGSGHAHLRPGGAGPQ
jgi:hypothetical protein